MTAIDKPIWTPLHPPLRSAASRKSFVEFARTLSRANRAGIDEDILICAREDFVEATRASAYVDTQTLLAAGLVVSDLAMQGWQIRVRSQSVAISPPQTECEDRTAEKTRIRRQELLKRDAQLRQPAVKTFLRSMERPRLYGTKFVSIFSLMRDGRELAERLREARAHRANGWADALSKAVDPYIDFVKSETIKCPHTGLRLMDIWRYFRHTWSNQYTSVPGRSMLFLVRERAISSHPVIGLGALCSPVMQLRERDEWIGWQPDTFLADIRSNPSDRLAKWFEETLDSAISEIFVDDFIEEKIVTISDIKTAKKEAIGRLLVEGIEQRDAHHRYTRQRDYKRSDSGNSDKWEARARSHLFRSKRALALARYLSVRAVLREFGTRGLTGEKLAAVAATQRGSDVIRTLLRKAKADRVGICMADISVCGAVQPYNAILGGKLVAMLAASPEAVFEYRQRYQNAESEIASAMAGRSVVRMPDLVLLGTTSLYGVGSSQYNRIRVPCDRIGGLGSDELRYEKLGHSEAFGTSQYADDTVEALTKLAQQSANGSRINSIFGEGGSPKLRKVRQGLDLLKLPADVLLKHHRHRIVYAVSLIGNLRNFLLGIDPEPEYLAPIDCRATAQIGDWWRERWLRNRIESEEVLAEVERHTLVRPVHHGARVVVPTDRNQNDLFPDD
jgi:hypothetical protein